MRAARLALHSDGLARKRGVVHLHVVGALHDTEVGGDLVAAFEQHNVAAAQVNGVDLGSLAVAHHGGEGRHHAGKGVHQVGGLALLQVGSHVMGEGKSACECECQSVKAGSITSAIDRSRTLSAPAQLISLAASAARTTPAHVPGSKRRCPCRSRPRRARRRGRGCLGRS